MTDEINLFLISTPLQLINVIEAKKELNIPNEKSVAIFATYSSNLVSIKQIINQDEWSETHFIDDDPESLRKHEENFKERRFFPVLKKAIENLRKINALIERYKKVDSLVVGYYLGLENLHFINSISYNNLYLLDDGIATIEINERRKKNLSFLTNQSPEMFLKAWFKKYILGYRIAHPKSLTFFSIYKIDVAPNDRLVLHSYREIKKVLSNLEKTNELYFLGQPLSEIHPAIVAEETYFEYLKRIKLSFNQYALVYIPHRDELDSKVKKIETDLEIKVKRINLPIELYLLSEVKRPSVLAGFITSALPNCKEIFGDELEIVAIRIDRDKIISRTMVALVDGTYAYFEKIVDSRFKIQSFE